MCLCIIRDSITWFPLTISGCVSQHRATVTSLCPTCQSLLQLTTRPHTNPQFDPINLCQVMVMLSMHLRGILCIWWLDVPALCKSNNLPTCTYKHYVHICHKVCTFCCCYFDHSLHTLDLITTFLPENRFWIQGWMVIVSFQVYWFLFNKVVRCLVFKHCIYKIVVLIYNLAFFCLYLHHQ